MEKFAHRSYCAAPGLSTSLNANVQRPTSNVPCQTSNLVSTVTPTQKLNVLQAALPRLLSTPDMGHPLKPRFYSHWTNLEGIFNTQSSTSTAVHLHSIWFSPYRS
ncbi:unnamed protein product [Cyclocybe aegerita]|uniref:Uncharacterized protein n=1 Tax=Cyclocybe aegerita TaxID=1973307 RepID=A0A8S0WC62_CYCAE|nr:unnamed protein product [Cyclocybe aegerita]